MTDGRMIRVRVANQSIDLPILGDEANTRRLAKQIDERIKDIENDLGRVNSQSNAIQAACEYAYAADLSREDSKRDQDELGVALERIATRLRRLAEDTKKD